MRGVGSLIYLAGLALYLILNARRYDAVLVFHLKQSAAVATVLGRFLGKRVVLSDQAAGELGDVQSFRTMTFGRLIRRCCWKAHALHLRRIADNR